MSFKSQSANMRALAALLGTDLGYIWGKRESGPNGEKKVFHSKGRAFLSALGKDLGFSEMQTKSNYGGIAVSGEIILRGLRKAGNGLYVELSQDIMGKNCIMYRRIHDMKDYGHFGNNFIRLTELSNGEYDTFLSKLLGFREAGYERNIA